MEENSEKQVFYYKNVPVSIIRYNGKPYVDCRNIGRLLKRCISGWVKDNRNQIAIYCNSNGIKVNKAIITNRWLLEDIALTYAKSIGNDFYIAMKQAINEFNVSSTINYKPMNQLTKSSTNEEIKAYFNAILKLQSASEEFPVNLDEVWPLVYSRKQEAVRALTSENSDFVEGIDYQPMRQNAQRSEGGKFTVGSQVDYMLSVSCLEFFIARKVRSVFEVYRKVFHKTAKQLSTGKVKAGLTAKVRASLEWVKGVKGLLNLNDSSTLLMLKQVAEPLDLPVPDYTPSKGVLKSAGELLKENECLISAQVFNQKMIENGYMVELTRPSSRGGTKKFKSIVGEGLSFGENQVNPNNPKSTQPLYYEEKFMELLVLLQLRQIA